MFTQGEGTGSFNWTPGIRLTLTPAKARALLRRNTVNRSLNRDTVSAIKQRLMYDEPIDGPQGPVKFYADGTVADGQHRLTAIAEMPEDFSITIATGNATESASGDYAAANAMARAYSMATGESYHLTRALLRARADSNQGSGVAMFVKMMNDLTKG